MGSSFRASYFIPDDFMGRNNLAASVFRNFRTDRRFRIYRKSFREQRRQARTPTRRRATNPLALHPRFR